MKMNETIKYKNIQLNLNSTLNLDYFVTPKCLSKLFKIYLKELHQELLVFKAVKKFELNLSFISDSKMKKINHQYRKKNKTTDVLSFPLESNLYKNHKIKLPLLPLGDLFISPKVCLKQAKERQMSFERELAHLLVHGFWHLLDYDHERSAKDEKVMFKLEEKLLKRIVIQFPKL